MQLSDADGAHEAEDVKIEVASFPDEVGRVEHFAAAGTSRSETSGRGSQSALNRSSLSSCLSLLDPNFSDL